MKVLITSVPGFGHVCPVLPLARTLKANGHEVAFATSAGIAGFIEDAGCSVLPSGPFWLESDFSHTHTNAQPVPGYRNDLAEFVEQTVLPQLLDDVATHVARWSPDVIMSNDFEISGRVLAEKNAIPFVLLSSGPRLPRQLREQWQGPLFLNARRRVGLAEAQPLQYSLQWLHLCFSPEWYGFTSATTYQKADNEYGIRPEVFDGFRQWQPQAGPAPQSGELNVLCTLGTVFDKDLRIVRSVIEGVSPLVDQLWITQNNTSMNALVSELPANVHLLNSQQLSAALPDMDACISHGGTSTLTTALLHGVRNLLIPQGADQIINALVCNQTKLAVSLMNTVTYAANADQGRVLLTPDLIREGLQRLLDDASYQFNARRYQTSVVDLADMNTAVRLIEQLVASGAPVSRCLAHID